MNVPVVRRVKAPVSDAWVGSVVRAAQHLASKKKRPPEIGVVFGGDAKVKKLNASYRGKDKTTDVLSFGDGAGGGDIVISVPQARRQAAEAGHSLKNELAMLIVHGCLHLFGHDHAAPVQARRMFGLQQKALKSLGAAHPSHARFLADARAASARRRV